MAELKKLFEQMGFDNVETFIASGNVIFDSKRKPSVLEKLIAESLEKPMGYSVPGFLRTIEQLEAIAERTPFPPATMTSAIAYNVAFARSALTAAQVEALSRFESEIDSFTTLESEIYWASTGRQSESKFSNAKLERALGMPVTWRGINTVRRLVAKYS
jgi:uncharacterized protein (DUF1697 family)